MNSCIHSGAIKTSGDLPTTWYNYPLASAGTIKNIDKFDDTGNTEKATESICPKGWTLPALWQINWQRDVAVFSPVMGGYYDNGTLYNESTRGFWWNSEKYNSALRYILSYYNNRLDTSISGGRYSGFYIRCVPAP